MEITYSVTEQDYINFNLYHAENSGLYRKGWYMGRYGQAIFFFIVILILSRNKPEPVLIFSCLIGVTVAIAWICYYPKYYRNRMKRFVSKHIAEGKNNDFIGYQRMKLKEDCIEQTSSIGTAQTHYNAVERIGHRYDSLFIYIGAVKAYIVPISAFHNDQERDQFIQLLTQKTGITITE